MHRSAITVAIAALVAFALTAAGATAGSLITGAKVKDASLTGRDLKDRSVTARDLAPAARPIPRARLASVVEDVITDPSTGVRITVKGEKGADGAQGPAGAQGPQGTPGIADVRVVEQSVTVAPSSSAGVTAKCGPGERVVGGGARFDGAAGIAEDSYPLADTEQGWTAVYTNRSDSAAGTAVASAICARVG